MEFPDYQFLFCLSYAIPTYILYALIFYTIFISDAKHKFSGSFYGIFGISTVCYFVYSIIYYFNMRISNTFLFLPFVKSWGDRGFFITFIHAGSWYLSFVTHLINCLLAFNRLTVFSFKANYKSFWGRWLKYFLAFPILFPILLVWHIPFTDIYMEVVDPAKPDGIRFFAEGNKEIFAWMDNPRNSAILISITSTLSLGMNLVVIAKLMQQKYCMPQIHGKAVSPQDIKMTIYTLLIFLTDVASFVFMFFIISADNIQTIGQLLNIQQFLIDIQTLAPAWFVVITNKNLRKQIATYLGFKAALHLTTVAANIPTTTRNLVRRTRLSSIR